jgi:hypothetical protein
MGIEHLRHHRLRDPEPDRDTNAKPWDNSVAHTYRYVHPNGHSNSYGNSVPNNDTDPILTHTHANGDSYSDSLSDGYCNGNGDRDNCSHANA